MTDIQVTQILGHDIDAVYEVFWTKFTDLPAHLPSIQSITEIHAESKTEQHDHTHHQWQADPAVIPKIARPFVKPSLICWLGRADWLHDERKVMFKFEHHKFEGLYTCEGEYDVVPGDEKNTSKVVINAVLDIHGERIPGLPKRMAKKAGQIVEDVLYDAIKPALAQLPHAVEQFLPGGAHA